jgi:hypothetical protein
MKNGNNKTKAGTSSNNDKTSIYNSSFLGGRVIHINVDK